MNAINDKSNLSLESLGQTLEDVLATIDSWTDLKEGRRAQLKSHVRRAMTIQGACALPNHGPLRFTCEALSATLWLRAPACHGFESNRAFSNMVTDCRKVLTRLGLHNEAHELTPAWKALHDLVPTKERQAGVIGLMRFASGCGIAPDAVEQSLLDRFEASCVTGKLIEDVGIHMRRTASNWNWASDHLPGWPKRVLKRQDMRDHYGITLDQFPRTFQADLDAFLASLAADPSETLFDEGLFTRAGGVSSRRKTAATPRTVQTRREQIKLAATALVLTGTPIEEITSLRDLVSPLANARRALEFHIQRRKAREAEAEFESVATQLIGIADVLRQIAKYHCHLNDQDLAQLTLWKSRLTPRQQGTMSEQNQARLRALLETETYAKLLHLPQHLLKRAEDLWNAAREDAPGRDIPPPQEPARLVMFAVALEILLFCPLRRHNLIQLDLDHDFIRAAAGGKIARLRVLAHKTKTNETVDWPVPAGSANLIDRWIKVYRPVLAKPGNRFLFPGKGMAARNESEFASYFSRLVESGAGAKFNMHLARHFAVVRYLRANPGQYAIVSRLLQHKKVETTIRFYAGLEIDAAASHANQLLASERAKTKKQATAAFAPRRRSPTKPKSVAGGSER